MTACLYECFFVGDGGGDRKFGNGCYMIGGTLEMLSEERRSAIGRNICEARQRQGMTQAKLAEVTGAAVEVIAHAESGDDEISLEMLLEICSATGTLPDDILAGAYVINDAGKDFATSEAAHQGEESFSVADVSPEDRELLDHIVYFMAHKKPAR